MTLKKWTMTSTLSNLSKQFLVGCILALVSCLTVPTVFAQGSLSLSVSPTIFEMTANPGQEWNSTLRVVNTNPFPLTVYATVVNFKPLGEDGASEFIPPDLSDDARSSLAEWITVPSGEITIPPEETFTIPVTINPPTDAPPGGHYAAILVGTRPPDNANGTSVETSQFVSSLVFLRVAGAINESGSIRSFRTTHAVYEKPSVEFALRFENTGNVHLRPEGEIRIYNMWGQERGYIPVNQKTLFGKVLSESTRTFTFNWTGEWSPADIGRYTAVATLAYGDDGRQFASSEVAFWLIPWRVLLIILLVLAAMIYGVSWSIKLYIRRMLSLAGLAETPLREQLRSSRRPRRTVSVMAPIEAGILDLRSRLKPGSSLRDTVATTWSLIVSYRLFLLGVAIIGLSIAAVTWFVSSATDTERAYEVTVDRLDADVTLNSEQQAFDELVQELGDVGAQRNVPALTVVNRSGVTGAAAQVAFNLTELGYAVAAVETELDNEADRTVVVFDPTYDTAALDLSVVLGTALLSSYEAASTDPLIVIYVGKDLANQVVQ